MRFRILFIALMSLLAACDRAPLTLVYSNMPSDYEITAAEKAVVEQGLGAFMGLDTPPQTHELKTLKYAGDSFKVCGLIGQERFFAGDLIGAPGNQRFSVIAMVDTTDMMAPQGIDVHKLCRG